MGEDRDRVISFVMSEPHKLNCDCEWCRKYWADLGRLDDWDRS